MRHDRLGGIGASQRRREDQRLLTGEGCYTSDVTPERLSYAAIVRSPHAHARIVSIDVEPAGRYVGVISVLTGKDVTADGLQPIPHNPDWMGPPDAELRLPAGFKVFTSENTVLASEIVRYVGEPVALVIADTQSAAWEGADAVHVEYAPMPAVVDARAALEPSAPIVWSECAANTALDCEVGDRAAAERAFADAAHVVSLDTWVHRVTGSPMEPRAAIGDYDVQLQQYTLRAASGRGVVQTRERLALTLGVGIEHCRVISGDMGGNFGTRNGYSPEFTLMPWAARRVGRPVKWTADRRECFLSDYQARDIALSVELALDEDGRFLGMRGENTLNLGAHTVYFWPLRKGLSMMQGVYRIPAVHFRGRAVLTNTAPTAVYRSAGRPEAIFAIERLIELAADVCGLDRITLRKRNLIAPDELPFTNGVGVTYDSGDYQGAMDKALSIADWEGFEVRRGMSESVGRHRGIGVANYIEVTSGIPRERAELTALGDGMVELVVGTMSSGQSHETTFPQLVAEWLEVPSERVRFIANDTERVSVGGGSHSGRSMRLVSIAVDVAVKELISNGRAKASAILQTDESEVSYRDGVFCADSGASVTLAEVAAVGPIGSDGRPGLRAFGDITNRAGGYPYGAHVCEVEVDSETGEVFIVRWTCVDDVGRAVNPMVLHGQAHGAVTQGIGQALLERIIYESSDAQMLTGSFMDYAMPRADHLPSFDTAITEVPASSHPHGVRPGGEGGTTPALACAVNAVVNALHHQGVRHIEMPLTPEKVWQALQTSKKGPAP